MFQVNDEVSFEIGSNDDANPRWDYGRDNGASGKFAKGTVVNVREKEFAINFSEGEWWFDYRMDGGKPGFPQKVVSEEVQRSANALKKWFEGAG